MLRLLLILALLICLTPGQCDSPQIPTDIWELRTFAIEMNRYYNGLLEGKIDTAQWKKALSKWERMTNSRCVSK